MATEPLRATEHESGGPLHARDTLHAIARAAGILGIPLHEIHGSLANSGTLKHMQDRVREAERAR